MVDVITDISEDNVLENTPVAQRDLKFWIKQIAYRVWRLVAEFGAVAMGLSIFWLYGLSVLLTQQTMNVSGARSNLGLLFSEAVAGAGVDIPKISLNWYPATNDIVFVGEDITLKTSDGTPIQQLTELRSFFPLEEVSKGVVIPRKIVLNGGVVSWVEDEAGRIRAGLGNADTLGRLGPVWEGRNATSEQGIGLDLVGVESVQIRGATAYYINQQTQVDLTFEDIAFDFERTNTNLDFGFFGQLVQTLEQETVPVRLDIETDSEFNAFNVSFFTKGMNPAFSGPKQGRFRQVSDLNSAINLQGEFDFDRREGLQSATIDMEMTKGDVIIPTLAAPYKFESFEVSALLDAGQSMMDISVFNLSSEKLNFEAVGQLSELGAISDGDINSSPLFDLGFERLDFDFRPIFERQVRFQGFNLLGRLDADSRSLDIESLAIDRDTHQIQAQLFATATADGTLDLIRADGKLIGEMSTEEVLDLWPVQFVDGARRWVNRAILGGTIDSLSFETAFSRDEEGRLNEDVMALDYSVRDGTVRYISTMTPLTNASGTARIANNAMTFDLERGQIGAIILNPSKVEMPRLRPKGGDLIVTANAQGRAEDMLNLINQEPFRYADRYEVDPSTISGEGQATLTITRPLLEFFDRDRISYSVSGRMTGVSAPFRVGPHQLKNGDLSLEIDKTGLSVSGPVNIGPWRTNLEWKEIFDNGLTPTNYRVFGVMTPAVLDELGLSVREYLDGEIDVEIMATGEGVNLRSATMRADIFKTEMAFGNYWNKPANVDGLVTASLTRGESGTEFQSITMRAPKLDIEGTLSLTPNYALRDLHITKADIENFIQGSVKLAPDLERQRLSARIDGTFLDISHILDQSFSREDSTFDIPLQIDAKVDALMLDAETEFVAPNASLLYANDGYAMTALSLEAESEKGPISVEVETDVTAAQRVTSVNLPDASKAVSAFLGNQSVEGGTLELTGSLPLAGEEGPFIGRAIIEDFKLKDAPILAQLLSLGSLTGLFDTLSGGGLGFDKFEAPFQLEEGVLTVRDASVYGPALGMSGEGNINLTERRIDIDGAIVPAYTANSILGDIPVLGDIFVGKKGEGIFGLSYAVAGSFEATQITVNPLSALTPGFLRGIFRKSRDDMPGITDQERTREILDEAKRVAPEPEN